MTKTGCFTFSSGIAYVNYACSFAAVVGYWFDPNPRCMVFRIVLIVLMFAYCIVPAFYCVCVILRSCYLGLKSIGAFG